MKKRTLLLGLYGLLATAALYNCQNKEADPLSPSQSLLDKMKAIQGKEVELQQAQLASVIDGNVELAKKSETFNADFEEFSKTGVLTSEMQETAKEVATVLTQSEIAQIAKLPADVFAKIKAGGEAPANIKAILDKANASQVFISRQAVLTLPVVSGEVVKGGRIAAAAEAKSNARTGAKGAVEISDECLALAEEAFQETLQALEITKTTQTGAANTQYANALTAVAAAQTACNAPIESKYDAMRTKAATAYTLQYTRLDQRRAALGETNYWNLWFAIFSQELNYEISVNNLETAALTACTTAANIGTLNATAAFNANVANIQAAYLTNVAAAEIVRDELAESCHNQGNI